MEISKRRLVDLFPLYTTTVFFSLFPFFIHKVIVFFSTKATLIRIVVVKVLIINKLTYDDFYDDFFFLRRLSTFIPILT